jgi:hypothetical protein
MAVTASVKSKDSRSADSWSGGASTADNDVILEIDARGYTEFTFGASSGVFDVQASVDGTNFLTTLVGITNGNTLAAATVTVAAGVFILRGTFAKLRFMQAGATAVAGFGLTARKAVL